MTRYLAAALVAFAIATPVAGASTLEQKNDFINDRLTDELTPKEPWAHTRQVRISDGWAFQPHPLKDAWVSFVVTKGYVKPPKPEPVVLAESSSTPATANIGAGAGYSADWYAIAECEGGGDWSMVKPDADPYYFVLQFHPTTWLSFGGTQAELDAGVAPSPSRLIEVAERVLATQGPGAWPNCFAYA